MQLVSKGDTSDFEAFVASSTASLLRTSFLVVWDPIEAQDLVQECLLQVARRWPKVRQMEQPRAYARRILCNLALDSSLSRGRRRAELHPDREEPEVVDHCSVVFLDRVVDRIDMTTVLGVLPRRQRAVLVLRYFEDLSEAETAEALGCSLGTVKSTAARALERLRRELQSAGNPPPNPEREEGIVHA